MSERSDVVATGGREVAVVTGAAMGIGAEVARLLVSAGSAVVGVDWNEGALEQAAENMGGSVVPVVGDIADWSTHERAAQAAAELGRLAMWVNNAGVDVLGGAHEVTPEEVLKGLGVLQLGPMFGTAVAVRTMMGHGGSIVNVSSIQGMVAFPRYFVYQAAKAAVVMMSKGVAVDYAGYRIRCNAVLPGAVATPMTMSGFPPGLSEEEGLRREGAVSPMGRVADASEVARVITFLLSGEASYVTGAAWTVDGGATARCYPYPSASED